jgi:ubiquinone/menaquinone biosynthesis C-methylase UbiE
MKKTMTSRPFHRPELEPPPWLYALMAKGPLFRRIYRRFVDDVAGEAPLGARLLDVGTGPGYLLCYLVPRRLDLELVGLDRSFDIVRRGRARLTNITPCLDIQWLVADALALPCAPETFEQVLTTFSLHIWPDPARGLAEIYRVLKPGGRAWIYEMNREAPTAHLRRFAREERFPFFFVYAGVKLLGWHHALRREEFHNILEQAGLTAWRLDPAHHLFWRLEICKE